MDKNRYRAWVGNPKNWGLLAAHQFSVLTSLGLKSNHKLLDIGCGSLRGGRLFISYLEKGNYYGIEPVKEILDQAIEKELGYEFINKRQPSFDYNKDADLSIFSKMFDFILAHSVLIHAPKTWIEVCFKETRKVLKPNGKFVATVIFTEKDSGETDWNYPQARYHTKDTIRKLAKQANLELEITEIEHVAKDAMHSWIVLTHDKSQRSSTLRDLRGE